MNKLNNAQEAIKQAIEAGYKAGSFADDNGLYELTDPLFWIELGKARDWYVLYDPSGLTSNEKSARKYSQDWFDVHTWSRSREEAFWQSLP